MSRWFRHYAGMMRDDKLVSAAIRSKQTVERVVWIYGAILESAAEIDDVGRYDVDAAEIAYFLRADISDVECVVAALEAIGRIAGGNVVKWGDRQFQSDRSAERQRRYRDKKREQGGNADEGVTSPLRHADAPETETELDTEDSVANATGADAPKPPADLKADVFNSGVSLLTSTGTAERNARSMIGRWLKTYGDAPVLAVLVDAQARAIPDPIPWITRALENRYGGQSGIGVTARAAISVFGPLEQSGDGAEAGHA